MMDIILCSIVTQANCTRVGDVFVGVYVSACLFFRTMSEKPMQLRSSNSTQTWPTVIPGNPFILGSKGQQSRGRKITLPVWVTGSRRSDDAVFFSFPVTIFAWYR